MEQKQPLSKLEAALDEEIYYMKWNDMDDSINNCIDAFKEAIESIWPDNEWWEVCSLDIEEIARAAEAKSTDRDQVMEEVKNLILKHIKPEFIAEEPKVEESLKEKPSITIDQFNPEQIVKHCKEEEDSSSITIDMKDDLETKYLITIKPRGLIYGMIDKPYSILVTIDKESFPEDVDMSTPEAYDKVEERVDLRSIGTYEEVIDFLNKWKASITPKQESIVKEEVEDKSQSIKLKDGDTFVTADLDFNSSEYKRAWLAGNTEFKVIMEPEDDGDEKLDLLYTNLDTNAKGSVASETDFTIEDVEKEFLIPGWIISYNGKKLNEDVENKNKSVKKYLNESRDVPDVIDDCISYGQLKDIADYLDKFGYAANGDYGKALGDKNKSIEDIKRDLKKVFIDKSAELMKHMAVSVTHTDK